MAINRLTKVGSAVFVVPEQVMSVRLHRVDPLGNESATIVYEKNSIPVQVFSDWSPQVVINRIEAEYPGP